MKLAKTTTTETKTEITTEEEMTAEPTPEFEQLVMAVIEKNLDRIYDRIMDKLVEELNGSICEEPSALQILSKIKLLKTLGHLSEEQKEFLNKLSKDISLSVEAALNGYNI